MSALAPKLTPTGSVLIVISPHVRGGQVADYVLRTQLALRSAGWFEHPPLAWIKPDAAPIGRIDWPRRAWESVLWFSRSPNPYVNNRSEGKISNRFGLGSDVSDRLGIARDTDIIVAAVGGNAHPRQHPAVFPQDLAGQIIARFTRPGEVVGDPFSGSGTTGRAALALGRQFVGIEIKAEYVDESQCRIVEDCMKNKLKLAEQRKLEKAEAVEAKWRTRNKAQDKANNEARTRNEAKAKGKARAKANAEVRPIVRAKIAKAKAAKEKPVHAHGRHSAPDTTLDSLNAHLIAASDLEKQADDCKSKAVSEWYDVGLWLRDLEAREWEGESSLRTWLEKNHARLERPLHKSHGHNLIALVKATDGNKELVRDRKDLRQAFLQFHIPIGGRKKPKDNDKHNVEAPEPKHRTNEQIIGAIVVLDDPANDDLDRETVERLVALGQAWLERHQ